MYKSFLKRCIFLSLMYIPVYIKLYLYGIRCLKIFKFNNWHHGFCYFIGVYSEKKVFVKVDTRIHCVCNDKKAFEILSTSQVMADKLISVEGECLKGKIQFVLYEFLQGSELTHELLKKNRLYFVQMIAMVNEISKYNIIHRDLKLDNFYVDMNGELKIIDFTFAYSKLYSFQELCLDKLTHCSLLESLGNGLNPKAFLWDDFYSLHKIFDDFIKKNSRFQSINKIYEYRDEVEMNITINKVELVPTSKLYLFKRKLKNMLREE